MTEFQIKREIASLKKVVASLKKQLNSPLMGDGHGGVDFHYELNQPTIPEIQASIEKYEAEISALEEIIMKKE